MFTDGVDDRDYFADILTKEMQVGTEAVFMNILVKTRSATEQSAIIEQLFDTFRKKLAGVDPYTYFSDVVLSRLIAQKSIQHR